MKIETIGKQKLILGNSLECLKNMDKFDHIITDPPYEKSVHDSMNKRKSGPRKDGRAELKKLDFESVDSIRNKIVSAAEKLTEKWFIAFCTIEGTARWADAINESQLKYKRACVWVKPDATPQLNGQCPAQGSECFVCAWGGSGRSVWNSGGKRGIYNHLCNPRIRDGRHPTEKPVSLMQEIISDFVAKGDTILDPFMGSGTTLVAAQKMGFSAVGIEMNPDYFDVACQRVYESTRQGDLFIA